MWREEEEEVILEEQLPRWGHQAEAPQSSRRSSASDAEDAAALLYLSTSH